MRIYSVHDSKAEAYLSPIYFKTKGEALRAFETSCQDKDSNFAKYPSDFTMVELGEFNENDASITLHEKPLILANASEFAQKIQ